MESESDYLLSSSLFLCFPLLTSFPVSGIVFGLLFVAVLLLCSALISSSEVAFFSLNANDLKDLEQENSRQAQRILELREKPRTLLATILISNNFINIAIVIVSEYLFRNLLPADLIDQWSAGILKIINYNDFFGATVEGVSPVLYFLITVVGVTFLLVLFGEVAPKVYAKLNNLRLARFMSGVLRLLVSAFRPFSTLLVRGTNMIERRLAKNSQNGTIASREEIDQAIELTVKDSEHGKQDIDILKGIVKFGEVSVKQIMRSRVDVVAVDFRTSFEELMKIVKDSGFSRIPVYDEDFDSVTGMLYVKDLIGVMDEGPDFEWQTLIRTNVFYVPEAKKISDLLKEFQTRRLHMAIVVDEYGGSSGIATLEDIMEEIIGEIKDEFDDEIELEYIKLDDQNYIFEGKTLLNDVCRVIGVDTTAFDEVRGDADSVAGLVLELSGLIPKVDSEITYGNFRFKIVAVSKKRVEQIKITLLHE
ncbi:MAG: gliding motility-associated protein GldE [Bacteroidota bacterium]